MNDNPLGKATDYPRQYDPSLLVAIPRQENRQALGLSADNLPFSGADIWNAYELSCLDARGKPMVFMGRFIFPAASSNLVESKSLKLYLNSLNQERFADPERYAETISRDLERVSGAAVEVLIADLRAVGLPEQPAGTCLDDLELEIDAFEVNSNLLMPASEALFEEITDEVLYTILFRSNCPITNQPDWATVTVCYHGRRIPGEALLKYLVSYRLHNDYHENCIERIFCDLAAVYKPISLTVEANFLRRGGLDINPVRSTEQGLNFPAFPRFNRQ